MKIFMVRLIPSLMALFSFEALKRSMLKDCSPIADVRDYTCRAFSQVSKQDFFVILKGALGCLHYEPDYHISKPLLLVHGDNDRTGGMQESALLWARREPNCRYIVIPDAGHFAILDNPEFFNRILLEFLANPIGQVSLPKISGYRVYR